MENQRTSGKSEGTRISVADPHEKLLLDFFNSIMQIADILYNNKF
jgi:hypothetical protein